MVIIRWCQLVSHYGLFVIFISLLPPCSSATEGLKTSSVISTNGTLHFSQFLLRPGEVMDLSVSGPNSSAFILVQAHGISTVSLSFNRTLVFGNHANGSHIGLLLPGTSGQLFLHNLILEPNDVLVGVSALERDVPIPGGCSMEESTAGAPFLPLDISRAVVGVRVPLAAWPLNVIPASCDRIPLQYDVYHSFLPHRDFSASTAFASIRAMSSVEDIERNGKKVTFAGTPSSRVKFANYQGTGRVVAVIVRSLTASSAYVSTISYGCEGDVKPPDCFAIKSIGAKLFGGFAVFAGLFLAAFGHRYFRLQVFLLSGVGFGLVASTICLSFFPVSLEEAGVVGGGIGIAVGAIVAVVWSIWGAPVWPLFLGSLMKGGLLVAVVLYTPIGDIPALKEDLSFWTVFVAASLVLPAIFLSFDRLCSILSGAVIGSYMFLVPVDAFVGSGLKFILLNMMWRAAEGDFATAIIDPPYSTDDLLLSITWGVVAMCGVAFQLWYSRGRTPFPNMMANWPPRNDSRTERVYSEYEPLIQGGPQHSTYSSLGPSTPLLFNSQYVPKRPSLLLSRDPV